MIYPEYFIDNIGRGILPHYECLALLISMEGFDSHEVEEISCSPRLIELIENHSKYVVKETSGWGFWKKIFYRISPEGRAFLKRYRFKLKLTKLSLKQYIESFKDDIPEIEELLIGVESVCKDDFKNLVDFIVHKTILDGELELLYCMKRLHNFSSIFGALEEDVHKKIENIPHALNTIQIKRFHSDTGRFCLLLLLIDMPHTEVFDYYINSRVDEAYDNLVTQSEPEETDETDEKTEIPVEFSDDQDNS